MMPYDNNFGGRPSNNSLWVGNNYSTVPGYNLQTARNNYATMNQNNTGWNPFCNCNSSCGCMG